MTVATILGNKGNSVITAQPGDTVADVCAVLAEKRIGAVIVLADGDRIGGIVSERDIVRAISQHGADALSVPVSSIMTSAVVTCLESDTVNQVMSKMTEGRFRHVPVLRDGRLVGVISIGDVVKEKIAQVEADAELMRSYIASA